MSDKKRILEIVKRSKRGTIFMPNTFLPINNQYVSNVLNSLEKDGILIRLSQGIFLKPKITRFGPVMPSLYEIAEKIAIRDHAKILPYGPTAENYLGFSTQVPMNAVYYTNGSSRKLKVGNRTISFKYKVPSTFAYKGVKMPILVLALKSIGKNNINNDVLGNVERVLKQYPEESTWMEDIKLAPSWIRRIVINAKKTIHEVDKL